MALSVTSVTSAVLKGLDAFEVPVNPDDLLALSRTEGDQADGFR